MDSEHRWQETAGLTTRSEIEVSEAIQQCAKNCFAHLHPSKCIEPYLSQLRLEGWTDHDVNEVQSGALRVIAAITGKAVE